MVLVDNGSTDGSADVLRTETARPENRFASICTVERNRGYGFGILAGLRSASGRVPLAWTHADMQTDPNDVLLGLARGSHDPRAARPLRPPRRRRGQGRRDVARQVEAHRADLEVHPSPASAAGDGATPARGELTPWSRPPPRSTPSSSSRPLRSRKSCWPARRESLRGIPPPRTSRTRRI
ncbi:MAG: glycosyltransferase [Phycisphaerales bacterium]|nr:glycosyltransferase [Phycisphaerales bacterium]